MSDTANTTFLKTNRYSQLEFFPSFEDKHRVFYNYQNYNPTKFNPRPLTKTCSTQKHRKVDKVCGMLEKFLAIQVIPFIQVSYSTINITWTIRKVLQDDSNLPIQLIDTDRCLRLTCSFDATLLVTSGNISTELRLRNE